MAEEIKCPHCGASIEDVVNDEKTKQSNLKDLYKRYCECRDQELERFWKNSTYVWTFLVFCFTGYGVIMTSDSEIIIQNLTALSLFISIVGIVLSYLWLKMTQASKTWYEVYENAIWEMESYYNKFKADKRFLIHNFWASKNGGQGCSPSKIMVFIGKLLISVWSVAFFFGLLQFHKESTTIDVQCPCILGLFCIAIWLIVTELISDSTNSSVIRTREDNNIFNKIKHDVFPINQYLYFEIKKCGNDKYVVFKFSEENINIIDKIQDIFLGIKGEWNGYDYKYKLNDIKNHYENEENGDYKTIQRIYSLFNVRRINKIGNNIEVHTSEIDTDFEIIKRCVKEDEKTKIKKENNNKIVIPLECIQCE